MKQYNYNRKIAHGELGDVLYGDLIEIDEFQKEIQDYRGNGFGYFYKDGKVADFLDVLDENNYPNDAEFILWYNL